MSGQYLDITPSPRILRTLGEIPFEPWQCIAELVDNALDAFADASRRALQIDEPKVSVNWSSDSVAQPERTIEVADNGPGMTLDQVRDAARAGYSANDPIHNLGLFGMGFNIATARLGEVTRILSTTRDADHWCGLEIDYYALAKSRSFSAVVLHHPKARAGESGTKVVVSRLKGETYAKLRDSEPDIRRQLETIYTPILSTSETLVLLRRKQLSPRPHCIWGRSRSVKSQRDPDPVPAVIEVDRDLGNALFDLDKNAYIHGEVEDRLLASLDAGQALPANVMWRQKRLRGWVGIQRYSDPQDFGLDFIRNGRKVLIKDKSLFSYADPLTGRLFLEYPIELGSTVGGRIVGELHVDYLLPTYQKNGFDTSDLSWRETVFALRGGPILPKYGAPGSALNQSPIGRLVTGYRRADAGTRNLAIPRSKANEYLEQFRKGVPEYQSDEKWWAAAQQADVERATKGAGGAPDVDSGSVPSDDPDTYALPPVAWGKPPAKPKPSTKQRNADSVFDDLLQSSDRAGLLSGDYAYGSSAPVIVRAWELRTGEIVEGGQQVPLITRVDGRDLDYIYNPRHPLFTAYPLSPKLVLMAQLAAKLQARDTAPNFGALFAKLVQTYMIDARIDRNGLQERAAAILDNIRERIVPCLADIAEEVLACIHESSGEMEETVNSLFSAPDLLQAFQGRDPKAVSVLRFASPRTLVRIVDRFPYRLLDGKLFRAPYESIQFGDDKATERSRSESKDRILSFLKDATWAVTVAGTGSNRDKDELARCSHSLRFLEAELGL